MSRSPAGSRRLLGAGFAIGIFATALSACVVVGQETGPTETGPGEVEFELAGTGGAAIVVPVTINDDGPFSFVLDTGATFTCVNQALSDRLELPARTGITGQGVGVGPEASGRMELVRIESMQVGSASASDLTACVIDLGGIRQMGLEVEGLLGLNFLRSFHVEIDFESGVLTLE